jgi:hypothetical protein
VIFARRIVAAGAILLAGCADAAPRGPIGLFTTLPLFWGESERVGDLQAGAAPHWALTTLRETGEVLPLDSLTPEPGQYAIRDLPGLVMAQPRALSPQENVALDAWVRGGGRLLLFADPLLTAESRYAPGDRRRPQDVALLSPILAHWGLRLEFDPDQPAGEQWSSLLGTRVPVNLAGRLVTTGKDRDCTVPGEGLAARCRLGSGVALIVADAALFETPESEPVQPRREALRALLRALATTG